MPRYRELTGLGKEGLVYEYTSSIDHDKAIERYVALVIAAHTTHLYEKGLLPGNIICALAPILREMVEKGGFIQRGYEDVFEAAEAYLEGKAGKASEYIWLGRSRNDHVSAALRLYVADKLLELIDALTSARRALLGLASKYGDIPIILHTHQQPSQVGNVSCLVLGWEEALASATRLLIDVFGLVARSPLGAGAGAGTLASLEPERLAELLGLGSVLSSLYGAGSRFDVAAAVLAASLFLVEASRIASDLITYSSPYVGVLRIPEEHVATSSAMPHKRNPVTLEVLRARAARAAGYAVAMLGVMHGLPYGYNLDLQEANPLMYSVLSDAIDAARVLGELFKGLVFDKEKSLSLVKRFSPISVELAEKKSIEEGKAFREAYAEVAALLRRESLGELAAKELGPNWPGKVLSLRQTGCKENMNIGKVEARIALDEEAAKELGERLTLARQRIIEFLGEVEENCRG